MSLRNRENNHSLAAAGTEAARGVALFCRGWPGKIKIRRAGNLYAVRIIIVDNLML
jgi:hypothetical protein